MPKGESLVKTGNGGSLVVEGEIQYGDDELNGVLTGKDYNIHYIYENDEWNPHYANGITTTGDFEEAYNYGIEQIQTEYMNGELAELVIGSGRNIYLYGQWQIGDISVTDGGSLDLSGGLMQIGSFKIESNGTARMYTSLTVEDLKIAEDVNEFYLWSNTKLTVNGTLDIGDLTKITGYENDGIYQGIDLILGENVELSGGEEILLMFEPGHTYQYKGGTLWEEAVVEGEINSLSTEEITEETPVLTEESAVTDPIDPNAAIGEEAPENPEVPADGEETVNPDDPAEPEAPTDVEDAENLEDPTDVENPVNPDDPTGGDDPANPDEPSDGDEPANPDAPASGENPENPDEPTDGENMVNPDAPADGENSANPDGSADEEDTENPDNPTEPKDTENSGNQTDGENQLTLEDPVGDENTKNPDDSIGEENPDDSTVPSGSDNPMDETDLGSADTSLTIAP